MKSLFGSHINLTAKVLDFRLQRQNIVASNLANITTPGYKAKNLEFEQGLQDALALEGKTKMSKTNRSHIPPGFNPENSQAELSDVIMPRIIQGSDNVNLDKEMGIMAKNTLMYNALTTVIRKNFEGLQEIISSGEK